MIGSLRFLALFTLLLAMPVGATAEELATRTLSINGQKLIVEVASTP